MIQKRSLDIRYFFQVNKVVYFLPEGYMNIICCYERMIILSSTEKLGKQRELFQTKSENPLRPLREIINVIFCVKVPCNLVVV